MAWNKAVAQFVGTMEVYMMGIGFKIKLKATAHIDGVILEDIPVIGPIIIIMDKEHSIGQMAVSIQENTKVEWKVDMASLIGQMENVMMVIGF